jgi:hypothetical protein
MRCRLVVSWMIRFRTTKRSYRYRLLAHGQPKPFNHGSVCPSPTNPTSTMLDCGCCYWQREGGVIYSKSSCVSRRTCFWSWADIGCALVDFPRNNKRAAALVSSVPSATATTQKMKTINRNTITRNQN